VTEPDPGRYRLQVAGPAARALAGRLPEKIAAAVYEFITTALLDNPHRVGNDFLCRRSKAPGRPDGAHIASCMRSTKTTAS
jgi:hypothetical protein